MRVAACPILLAVGATLAATPARAADPAACVSAVNAAQVARYDGHLRAAHDELVACSQPSCPRPIQDDCVRWLAEVDASLPTVVVHATWSDGRDAVGVRTFVDGVPIEGADRGRAIAIDPGERTFRFERAGARPVQTSYVIREGEKNRPLSVVFTPAAPVPPETAPPPTGSAPPADAATRAPVPVTAYAAAGVGVLGLASFAFFAVKGTNELDDLRSTCKPNCASSDVSSARTKLLVGDVSLAVGVAAFALAAWLLFDRPTAPRARVGLAPHF
jgi:hypothetical protein